jgi:hypothetical protein
MKFGLMVAVLALLLAPTTVFATDNVLVNTDAGAIVAQQQQEIREQAMARKGRYKDMGEQTRNDLFAKQDLVLGLLEGKQRSTELSELDQTTLFNSLEAIQAIVNNAEDERMVCRRERPTGSHRPQNVCKTVAQMRAEREQSQGALSNRDVRCSSCGDGPPAGW